MNKFKLKAIEQYKIADHLLNSTLPLIKDPKLLVGIIHNIDSSLQYAMEAILSPPENSTFNYQLELLRTKHNISEDHLKFISRIRNITILQKKSPIEFNRKDLRVLCSKDYEMETISVNDMKSFLEQTQNFLTIMENIITN